MATANIWEITLHSELFDQECANVFFYRGNALTSPDAAAIAESFEDQILPDIRAVTSADVFFEGVTVRDILATDTPHYRAIGLAGNNGPADTLPAHDAYSFLLQVGSNLTRPGHKRFPGVFETIVTDGVVTDGTVIADLQSLATTLAFNLFDYTTGLIPWAAAVVVKRILDGDNYRLPTTVGEAVTNLIVDAIPSLIVSTQNSRKVRS